MLGASEGACLGVDEGLHSEADSVDASIGQHAQPLVSRRRGRGFDRCRHAAQFDVECGFDRREQGFELRLGQVGRCPASQCEHRKPRVRKLTADDVHLPREGLQIGSHLIRRRLRLREEIAEAAPHLAERNMGVKSELLAILIAPHIRQRHGGNQRPIRRLMRIRVGVGDERLVVARGHGQRRDV